MDHTESKKCLNCGGILTFDPASKSLTCEYCQSSFSIEELETKEPSKEDINYCNSMNEYRCQNCGATVLMDETTASTKCAYCHSSITLIGKLSGDIKPNKIIPFAFDKQEAKNIFLNKVKGYKFIPNNYFSSEQIENIQGIYYPFWIVDAKINVSANLKSQVVKTRISGDYKHITTSVFSHLREGEITLEDVSSCAIKNVDRSMLEGILPYPFDKYEDFNSSYLTGFTTQKRNLEKGDLTGDVHFKIKQYSIDKLLSTIAAPYSSITVIDYKHTILNEEWSYALVPIYLLTYKKKDKVYTFAINGYTKKVYGEYPISYFKVTFLGIMIVVIAMLIGMVGGFLW